MTAHVEIVESETGYEVLVYPPVTPVVAGRFDDREYAEKFYATLKGGMAPEFTIASKTTLTKPLEAKSMPTEWADNPADEPAETSASEKEGDDPEEDEQAWAAAIERVAAGEKLKVVAEDLGLSFFALRAKWANARKAGKYPDPKDAPVSGGVGGVLKRGAKQNAWSSSQDEAIMAADDSALPDLARLYNVPLYAVTRRREQLQARITRTMAEPSP